MADQVRLVAALHFVGDSPILHLSLPIDDVEKERVFYVDVLGCRPGRIQDDWFDVWFFGMQITLQQRPNEVAAADQQGARHFGVAPASKQNFEDLVARVNAASIGWNSPPSVHSDPALSGKVGGKLADPSGAVIEVKYYEDVSGLRSQCETEKVLGHPAPLSRLVDMDAVSCSEQGTTQVLRPECPASRPEVSPGGVSVRTSLQ